MRRATAYELELFEAMDEEDGIEYGAASREIARRELASRNRAVKRDAARAEKRRVARLRWDGVGAFGDASAADARVMLAQLLTELPSLTGSMRRMAQRILQEYGETR